LDFSNSGNFLCASPCEGKEKTGRKECRFAGFPVIYKRIEEKSAIEIFVPFIVIVIEIPVSVAAGEKNIGSPRNGRIRPIILPKVHQRKSGAQVVFRPLMVKIRSF